MKELKPIKVEKPFNLVILNQESCGCSSDDCSDTTAIQSDNNQNKKKWVIESIETEAGTVPIVATEWSRSDRWGEIRSRTTSYRMKYTVNPGLYGVGKPDKNSDVVVTANYKLSFDIVRRSLEGKNIWILVLDTKGINVWCAAGKGTFGTEELIYRIKNSSLSKVTNKKQIIVPQLGGVGVSASAVRKETGFKVVYGPVEAKELPAYIDNNYKATDKMRRINFSLWDRVILTPMEFNPAMKKFYKGALVLLILLAIKSEGIMFKSISDGIPLIMLGFLSVIFGAIITPTLLPFIPFRSFAIKGWIAGLAIPIIAMKFMDYSILNSIYIQILTWIIFPLLSSYLALQFTGSTTYTGMTGVEKEIKLTLPVYIAGLIISPVLILLYKLSSWGLI